MNGRVIAGRYQLDQPIGRGAMGVVWRARDELLDRNVAVKEVVISEALSDDERQNAYQRTLREARTAARLSHRGVVAIYDVAEEDGRPWIIMELVHARSLEEILSASGPLSPRRAGQMGQQLLAALATAHAAGVLHRDVKPSNVLLGEDGRAVLTDFGIATFQGDPRLTQTGMVMGSPGYTAPERIRGGPATPASDLWSLGATLFTAVEGHGPFEQRGGAITTMSAIIHEDPPPAASAGPLGGIVSALLRREPSARPDALTASRLIAGLLPVLPEERVHVPTGAGATASAMPAPGVSGPGVPGPGVPGPGVPAPGVPAPGVPGPGVSAPGPAATAPGHGPASGAGGDAADQGRTGSGTADLAAELAAASASADAGVASAAASALESAAADSADSGGTGSATPVATAPSQSAPEPSFTPTPSWGPRAGSPGAAPLWGSQPSEREAASAAPQAPPAQAPPAQVSTAQAPPGGPTISTRRMGKRGWRIALSIVAVVLAAVAGASAALAIRHHQNQAPGASTTSENRTPPSQLQNGALAALNNRTKQLPAGSSSLTVPPAVTGTLAGFSIAVPDGWKTIRIGTLRWRLYSPDGGFLHIDLTRHTFNNMLKEATFIRNTEIKKAQLPGYSQIALRRATVRGYPGAIWEFSWLSGEQRVHSEDILFRVPVAGGYQSYALYMVAPANDWTSDLRTFEQSLSTFEPVLP